MCLILTTVGLLSLRAHTLGRAGCAVKRARGSAHEPPELFWTQGHVEVGHAEWGQPVDHGVDDGREDQVDASQLFGPGRVEAYDAGVGVRGTHDPGVSEPGQGQVVDVLRLPADESRVLEALDLAADEAGRWRHRVGFLCSAHRRALLPYGSVGGLQSSGRARLTIRGRRR